MENVGGMALPKNSHLIKHYGGNKSLHSSMFMSHFNNTDTPQPYVQSPPDGNKSGSYKSSDKFVSVPTDVKGSSASPRSLPFKNQLKSPSTESRYTLQKQRSILTSINDGSDDEDTR